MPKKISLKRLQSLRPRIPENNLKKTTLKKLKLKTPTKFQNDFILSELGITFESNKKDFSLKTIANDKEFINNPKILEMDNYKRLEQEYDRPDDKFPNEDDPFYQLDEQRDALLTKVQKVKTSEFSKDDIVRSIISNNNLKQLR
tara:strand:- start:31 stop:462 length:432 start_codon:yes stop_codon:yes gene_type:complete